MGLKIVLITTGQPSCNPRLVKEADYFYSRGCDVTVLYNYYINWAEEKDKLLLAQAGWKSIKAGADPAAGKYLFTLAKLRQKIIVNLNRLFGNQFLLAEHTQAPNFRALLRAAKSIKADWYIGHNLGALAVAVKAAEHNKGKAAFDFEDYHQGEGVALHPVIRKRYRYLEEKYLPLLQHISASSEMIASAVAGDHPLLKKPIKTIYNCFPLKEQPAFAGTQTNGQALKLFWFSQTIGLNRGLENVVRAMQRLKNDKIQLTLAGRQSEAFTAFVEREGADIKEHIYYAGIIDPARLALVAADFDIGLCLEPRTPENSDFCLANKIFTYLLAGNAMILSDTSMHKAFNQRYNAGIVINNDNPGALISAISELRKPGRLSEMRERNYQLASQQFNWDKESQKLNGMLY